MKDAGPSEWASSNVVYKRQDFKRVSSLTAGSQNALCLIIVRVHDFYSILILIQHTQQFYVGLFLSVEYSYAPLTFLNPP